VIAGPQPIQSLHIGWASDAVFRRTESYSGEVGVPAPHRRRRMGLASQISAPALSDFDSYRRSCLSREIKEKPPEGIERLNGHDLGNGRSAQFL
jgi:hypothetical protein